LRIESSFYIQTKKCYGICNPDGTPYRLTDGYRRLHYIVLVSNKSIEIQMTTPYMTLWADWSHDIIYKGPSDISSNLDVQGYQLQLAEYYFLLDTIRDTSPTCPIYLQQMNVLQQQLGTH